MGLQKNPSRFAVLRIVSIALLVTVHVEALTQDDAEHIFRYIISNEKFHNSRYDSNPHPAIREMAIGIGFKLNGENARADFEGALPGVNFDDVRYGLRTLTDGEIAELFKIASLPKHIERVRNLLPDFDSYDLNVQAALVDSIVGHSLRCNSDETECTITSLINDPGTTWTQVCVKYVNDDRFWNAEALGTQDDKSRLRKNCQFFYSYGQSVNTSIAKYNPCSSKYELFYPYGPEVGDNVNELNDDGSSGQVFISTLFPFFDQDHDFLWINTNGVISFLEEVDDYTPLSFPMGDEWRLITPFWADIDTEEGGNVFWRETYDQDDLDKATRHIREYFVEEGDFTALWALVATWDGVAYYGTARPNLTNTFQAILITNGRHSFTIFNYGDIVWTTGTSSEGDENTGLGGTPAQVGFNSGDGVVFYSVPGSQNSSIVDIELTSNRNVPGRYAFRVDTADIEGGDACDVTGSLIAYPFTGTMLGGEMITVGGPCFQSTDDVVCKFGDQDTPGSLLSTLKATCITPLFYEVGRIPFKLSLDGGRTYGFKGIFTVLNIERTEPKVTRVNADKWHSAKEFEITWDATLLDSRSVDIHLLGYREDSDSGSFGWERIATLISGYDQSQQDGRYTFSAPVAETRFEVGAIRINRHTEEQGFLKLTALWSDVHDLKWLGTSPDVKRWCKSWSRDESLSAWTDDAEPCPCTLQQARADTGRYSPHPRCRIGSACDNKPGAVHCVRVNTNSESGSGRECCYNKAGDLLHSGDFLGAGPSHRSHHGGVPPYKTIGKVPYLSHFHDDLRPWLRCCVYTAFSELQCRQQYFARRPSNDCRGYTPPRPAITFGDPHIITLDGHAYTFNGFGEFTMLDIGNGNFTLQGRMAPMESNGIATVFNAFGMKSVSSDVVHVERNDRRKLDAYVRQIEEEDWVFVDFEEGPWWEFQGVSLSRTNISDNKISILFDNGISIDVSTAGQAMTSIFLAPPTYKNQTQGLMGTWNDDPNDDLLTPQGDYLPVNSTLEEIHREFGLKWMISAEESLFRYRSVTGESHASLNDEAYRPIFELPDEHGNDTKSVEICGEGNLQCIFDYRVTLDEQIAAGSRHAGDIYAIMMNATRPVVACGYIPAPPNTEKTGLTYIEGSTLMFDCLPGYSYKNGSRERACRGDGTWSGTDITCDNICRDLEAPVNGSRESTGTDHGSVIDFKCDEGFDLVGSETRRCQDDGSWDGDQPICRVVTCHPLTAPDNGTVTSTGNEYLSVTTLSCDVGFVLRGSRVRICRGDGEWDGKVTSCAGDSGDSVSAAVIAGCIVAALVIILIVVVVVILLCLRKEKTQSPKGPTPQLVDKGTNVTFHELLPTAAAAPTASPHGHDNPAVEVDDNLTKSTHQERYII